jgi:hypothetical protein
MLSKASLVAFVLGAAAVSAQAPPYQGALLLQAGSNAGKCLRADNKNGAKVTIASCTGGSDQEWTFKNGAVTLYNGAKCLDVVGGKKADGAKLQVWDCSAGSKNQQWVYTPWGDNHLQWKNMGKCVDLPGGSLNNGNQVQVWSCTGSNPNQVWNTGYMYNKLPSKSEVGQTGTNQCGTSSSQSSNCQTMFINEADDFCIWAPPKKGGTIGDLEREVVAWCTKKGRGTRVIPDGTLKGVHFVRTKDYVQVTGVGDFTKMNILKKDQGGELDPHGPDGNGNPVGGLVYGNTFGKNLQYHEWTAFISETQFCMRACTGPNARENCQHIYDEMGCEWNMPANYSPGKFESCKADNDLPMGVYGTSTWHQGVKPTPAAHPAAKSSSCTPYPSITAGTVKRDLSLEKLVKRVPSPMITPPPA